LFNPADALVDAARVEVGVGLALEVTMGCGVVGTGEVAESASGTQP